MVIRAARARQGLLRGVVAAEMKAGRCGGAVLPPAAPGLEGFNEHTEPIMTEAKEAADRDRHGRAPTLLAGPARRLARAALLPVVLGPTWLSRSTSEIASAMATRCRRQSIVHAGLHVDNGVTRGRVRVADPDRPRELLAVGEGRTIR